MANDFTWEQATARRIYELNKAIELPQNRQNYKDQDALTYEQAWEYSAASGLDERFPYPLQIGGTEFAIQLQVSLGKWLHDTLGRRLGYLVRFEDFWEQWSEKGFTWAINRTGTLDMQTNYPFRDVEVDNRSIPGWRTDRDTRPAYLEWKNPNPKANPYYRIIEYWPNRSQIGKSFVLVGSDHQIIQHIIAIEYQGGSNVAEDDFIGGGFPKRMGQPQVTLYFQEDKEDVEPGWKPIKGTIAFRLMDVTDNPDDSRTAITWLFIENLAKGIYEEFARPNHGKGFVWRKGKTYFNYHLWDDGYGFQILCRSPPDGQEIVQKVLTIRGHTFDATKASQSSNLDEANAYPTIPPKVNLLGRDVQQRRRRPIADVRFRAARLVLSRWDSPIPLVRNGTVENFLTDGREGELG